MTLNSERIQASLTTAFVGRPTYYRATIGSTMDEARRLAERDAPEGTVIVADEQTAGRGRMERQWFAPPGTCILCSILFRPDLAPVQGQWLTMLCAMAAADAVDQVTGLQVSLKWPNDLIVQAQQWKKLAGILTETGVTGNRLSYAVVGIGINVNVAPRDLPALAPDATSILAETGKETDRTVLLAALLAGVEARYTRLQAGTSPHAEWAARLATLGRPVEASTFRGPFAGIAESVDENGALLLRTPDGKLHRLVAGDVTLARR